MPFAANNATGKASEEARKGGTPSCCFHETLSSPMFQMLPEYLFFTYLAQINPHLAGKF